jgi:hypothetical protein
MTVTDQPVAKKEPIPVVKKPVAATAPVKPPSREFKMNTHYISYYGKEIVRFTEEEV